MITEMPPSARDEETFTDS